MKAYCLIREQPLYRRDVFVKGLRAAGCDVLQRAPVMFDADTVLLIWNRYGANHDLATQAERHGATVLVAENGYLSEGGGSPKFEDMSREDHRFAIARGYHNGGGSWHIGTDDRWAQLRITLQPWRKGDYILVCPNRAFGVPDRMMPPDWPEKFAASLKRSTNMPVIIRYHPGNDAPKRPLAADLERAQAVAVWYSSAGLHALIAGVPVISASPYWIGHDAASRDLNLKYDDVARLSVMQRVAWAQWSCKEIESGEPFRYLLGQKSGGVT